MHRTKAASITQVDISPFSIQPDTRKSRLTFGCGQYLGATYTWVNKALDFWTCSCVFYTSGYGILLADLDVFARSSGVVHPGLCRPLLGVVGGQRPQRLRRHLAGEWRLLVAMRGKHVTRHGAAEHTGGALFSLECRKNQNGNGDHCHVSVGGG